MSRLYRDEIAMVCHDMMKSAQSVGAINETEMRNFEIDCFVEEPETPHYCFFTPDCTTHPLLEQGQNKPNLPAT